MAIFSRATILELFSCCCRAAAVNESHYFSTVSIETGELRSVFVTARGCLACYCTPVVFFTASKNQSDDHSFVSPMKSKHHVRCIASYFSILFSYVKSADRKLVFGRCYSSHRIYSTRPANCVTVCSFRASNAGQHRL